MATIMKDYNEILDDKNKQRKNKPAFNTFGEQIVDVLENNKTKLDEMSALLLFSFHHLKFLNSKVTAFHN